MKSSMFHKSLNPVANIRISGFKTKAEFHTKKTALSSDFKIFSKQRTEKKLKSKDM